MMKRAAIAVLLSLAAACPAAVTTGLDRVKAYSSLFVDKRIGIICNHTAVDTSGRHIVEVFQELPGVKVTALFAPEHGVYGSAQAGEQIADNIDPRYGIRAKFYGSTRKPTPEIADVDVPYSTSSVFAAILHLQVHHVLAMEAAAENEKLFVVLTVPTHRRPS